MAEGLALRRACLWALGLAAGCVCACMRCVFVCVECVVLCVCSVLCVCVLS